MTIRHIVAPCIAMLFGLMAMTTQAAPPKITTLFPAGAARGQTVTVTAVGDFSTWPAQVWSDRPGLKFTATETKGKFQLTVDDQAQPGTSALRFFNADGATSLVPFVIGNLKERDEVEPNETADKSETIDGPTTINGRLGKSGDVDCFVVPLKQGQTLVAALQANSELNSPMDAVMQLCSLVTESTAKSPKNDRPQFKEAYVLEHNDDAVGLDPRIVFQAKQDGWYLIRLFAFPVVATSSISFAGGDEFVYRLTLTTQGFLDHSFPLAISRNQDSDVQLFGWNLANDKLRLPAPTGLTANVPLFRNDLAGVIQLPVMEHASVIDRDAKNVTAPQAVTLPVTITGRIDEPGDRDHFRVTAIKGQKIRAAVESRILGYELDPFLIITDPTGKKVAEADDSSDKQNRDPDLTFTAAMNGDYRITVRDAHLHGGFRFVYRMTLTTIRPDFSLTLKEDSFILSPDKPLELSVTVNRLDGFSQPIEVQAEGLPAGVICAAVVSEPKGDSAKAVKLVLKTQPDVPQPFQGTFRIVGSCPTDPPIRKPATFSSSVGSDAKSQPWLTKSASK